MTCRLCNNQGLDGAISTMMQNQSKLLVWFLLAALAAALTFVTFRAYLSPELLLGFANTFSC